MTILEAMKQLRDDLKLWVTNNLRVKMDKNLGTEESGKLLAVDEEGNVVASDKTLEDIKETFVITVDENGICDKTFGQLLDIYNINITNNDWIVSQAVIRSYNGLEASSFRFYEYKYFDPFENVNFVFSCVEDNILYECKITPARDAEGIALRDEPAVSEFSSMSIEEMLNNKADIDVYDTVSGAESISVEMAKAQSPIEVTLSSDTYTDFSNITVLLTHGETSREAAVDENGAVAELISEPEFELSLSSTDETFDAALVNIECRYQLDLERTLHDYVLHVDLGGEGDYVETIPLNSVYIQNDEPSDAAIGTIWIDTNETGLDVPGEEYNKNLYIIDSGDSDSSNVDFSGYAVGDIILVTSS